jgi:predicted alpha/beta superfamily hydrolase
MYKQTLFILFGFLSLTLTAQYKLHLSIHSIPSSTPKTDNLYIAGTFNNWNPKDEQYKFTKDSFGNYSADLPVKEKTGEYKLTRGGWDKVESDRDGNAIANRQYNVEANDLLGIIVNGWTDQFVSKQKISTASKNVVILDTVFFIPQLKRKRTIRIYLPEDYATSKQRYPVLYMQDGQNLFDEATSFAGEWGIDEFMDSMKLKKTIVVGIDNGADKRMNEYNPFNHKNFGVGEGNEYLNFLVKIVKPFIDKEYRTLKDKQNTSISGSSMGGLISFYALVKYPGLFGAAGVYSPSFWIAPGLFESIKTKGKLINSKIYFFAGKLEGDKMVNDAWRMYEAMHKVSKSKMKLVIKDDGKHNEATWRNDFPNFYKWVLTQ